MNTLPARIEQSPRPSQASQPVSGNIVAGAPVQPPGGPATAPPSAWAMLNALRRRWWLALLLAIPASAAAVAAVWFVYPPSYTAQTLLHLAAIPPRGVLTDSTPSSDIAAFQRTTLASIKTRTVLTAAIKKLEADGVFEPGKEAENLAWLEKGLLGDFTQGPEVLRLSLKGQNPDELAAILNTITGVYLDQVKTQDVERREARLNQLQASYQTHEAELRIKQEQLRGLEKKIGVVDPQAAALSQQTALAAVTAAEVKLQEAQVATKRAQLEVSNLKARLMQKPRVRVPEPALTEALATDAVAERTRTQLGEVQQQINDTLAVAGRGLKEPTLQPLIKQREALEATLESRRKELEGRLEAQLQDQALQEIQGKLVEAEQLLALQEEAEKLQREDVQERKAALARLQEKPSAEWESLRGEVARAEASLQRVGAEMQALKMEPPLPARVNLMEKAEPPRTNSRDKTLRLAGAAGVGVFGLVFLAVAFLEFRARRITSPEEVLQSVGMNVVGNVPLVPEVARRNLVPPSGERNRTWHTILTESVDATRTLLLHAAQAEGIRTVMISSAVSGEGKTSLTCQLGASLARAGQRTLIVDFDLRKPSLHELFGLPLTPGIREIMRGEAHASECWRASRIEGLSVLPAGHGDHFRSPLTQEAVQLVFEQLKGEFDFILIDSSPVLPVADALVIGQHTDGVLFSVLRDVSRIPLVTAASQRLERLGVRLLGAVFVGAKGDVYGHSYQYTASAAN